MSLTLEQNKLLDSLNEYKMNKFKNPYCGSLIDHGNDYLWKSLFCDLKYLYSNEKSSDFYIPLEYLFRKVLENKTIINVRHIFTMQIQIMLRDEVSNIFKNNLLENQKNGKKNQLSKNQVNYLIMAENNKCGGEMGTFTSNITESFQFEKLDHNLITFYILSGNMMYIRNKLYSNPLRYHILKKSKLIRNEILSNIIYNQKNISGGYISIPISLSNLNYSFYGDSNIIYRAMNHSNEEREKYLSEQCRNFILIPSLENINLSFNDASNELEELKRLGEFNFEHIPFFKDWYINFLISSFSTYNTDADFFLRKFGMSHDMSHDMSHELKGMEKFQQLRNNAKYLIYFLKMQFEILMNKIPEEKSPDDEKFCKCDILVEKCAIDISNIGSWSILSNWILFNNFGDFLTNMKHIRICFPTFCGYFLYDTKGRDFLDDFIFEAHFSLLRYIHSHFEKTVTLSIIDAASWLLSFVKFPQECYNKFVEIISEREIIFEINPLLDISEMYSKQWNRVNEYLYNSYFDNSIYYKIKNMFPTIKICFSSVDNQYISEIKNQHVKKFNFKDCYETYIRKNIITSSDDFY